MKPTEQAPAPVHVPVINPDARLFDLAHYTDKPRPESERRDGNGREIVVAREFAHLHAFPGLNYFTSAQLAAAQLTEHETLRIGSDPCKLDLASAIKLAGDTASAPALRRWREIEKRPKVIEAIDKRLASRKAKEVS